MWVETKFEGDPIAAVKLALSSHSTGKLVLDVSEGTVLAVTWMEKVKKATPHTKVLDRVNA
jgi:hypothetical protein